jgi:hypothetical protein
MCQEYGSIGPRRLVGLVVLFLGLLSFLPLSSAIAAAKGPRVAIICRAYDYDHGAACTTADSALALDRDTRRDVTIRPTRFARAAPTIHQITRSMTSAEFVATKPGLVDELAAKGVKHNPGDIVRIARDPSGRVVFLEN